MKKVMFTLINTLKNNRFFQKKRDNRQCMWISKTQNKKGNLAEIFKVDDKGRKCYKLVQESVEIT
ncbi:hypothetical protein Csa_023958 [Cucumis sativus]|nr:hypothetical protein Csa_023958 [Cucumis sativus]